MTDKEHAPRRSLVREGCKGWMVYDRERKGPATNPAVNLTRERANQPTHRPPRMPPSRPSSPAHATTGIAASISARWSIAGSEDVPKLTRKGGCRRHDTTRNINSRPALSPDSIWNSQSWGEGWHPNRLWKSGIAVSVLE